MDQNSENDVWINISKTTWPSLNFDTVVEFLGQFTIRCKYYFFQKDIHNFEIEHKTC